MNLLRALGDPNIPRITKTTSILDETADQGLT